MVRKWLPLIAFVAFAAPAGAADITLNVPVRIVNLPSATDFELGCGVFTPGKFTPVAGSIPVRRTVTGGAFSETIAVEVSPVLPPYTTLTYVCNIVLNGNSAVVAGKWQAANDTSLAEFLPRLALQKVKASTMLVTGPVPTK